MNQEELLEFYELNYDVVYQGFYSSGKEILIGDTSDLKRCRFCGKNKKETTFKTKAHAIPEFLGNHQLISSDECDICNKYISENLEDHLDKFTKPFRLIAQIKGKTKVPSYRSNDKKSRIDFVPEKGIEIKSMIDSPITSFSEDGSELKINTEIEPYIPASAYKALCKIAISLCPPDKLELFKHTILWIKEEIPTASFSPLKLHTTFIPGPCPNPGVTVFLLTKKTFDAPKLPTAFLVLAYGNFIYQIIVPSYLDAKNGSNKTFEYKLFPSPFMNDWKYGDPAYSTEDLSSNEKIKGTVIPIRMHYDQRIEKKS